LKAVDLPESLKAMRSEIERAVPHGFVTIKGRSNKGAWAIAPHSIVTRWKALAGRLEAIKDKTPRLSAKDPQSQLGTLGGGNHFIEICLDTEQTVWVMLHSGCPERLGGDRAYPQTNRMLDILPRLKTWDSYGAFQAA
jgi:tRNA-splicing ligase RtcB (3'-phosphate/5'-hydroxy nucleic acid ligase)